MERGCSKAECTVAETGKCVLNRDPAECSELLPDAYRDGASEMEAIHPLPPPIENPRLPNSLTLDQEQIRVLAASRRTSLIGVLGAPDSGKTAALVSMYLLLAHNRMEVFRYASSLTLMALDEISRGARRWNEGARPEQMTAHTEISAERGAGFMHLRLFDNENRMSDLLIPDLPGEWSNSLIDSDRVERWTFLKSADILCFFVDGRQLATKRQATLHRTKLLIQKAAAVVAPRTPPAVVVISHRDTIEPNAAVVQQLADEAARYKLPFHMIPIASFTAKDSPVRPGLGILELVRIWANPPSPIRTEFWPDRVDSSCDRAMLRFRKREMT